ncbi:hypothetical protein JHK87_004580 [Glycine soja]|nr:hypothetical protein JHK87_004580 [Glycine soja]
MDGFRKFTKSDRDTYHGLWSSDKKHGFPTEGSKITLPDQSVEFRWKDYCPMVFRQLRKLCIEEVIVMGNLFCSEYQIHKRFDLKGSSHGQTTDKTKEIDETTTLKDLDLNFVFRLQNNWFQDFINSTLRIPPLVVRRSWRSMMT